MQNGQKLELSFQSYGSICFLIHYYRETIQLQCLPQPLARNLAMQLQLVCYYTL